MNSAPRIEHLEGRWLMAGGNSSVWVLDLPATEPGRASAEHRVPTKPAKKPPPEPAPAPAARTTYVVDPAGPIRTIQAAADLAQPGDTVLINPGVYHESIRFNRSGTLDNPILFVGAGTADVIIDGSGFSSALTGGQYVTIRNLTVRNCSNGLQNYQAAVRTGTGWRMEDVVVERVDATGICVFGNNVTLLRVISQDNGEAGIGGDHCSNVLVQDCISRRNNRGVLNPVWKNQTTVNGYTASMLVNGLYHVNPDWEAGGGKWWTTDRVTIRGMQSYDNVGPGIWFDYNNTNAVLRNNTVHHNRGLPGKSWQGAGIRIELQSAGPTLVEDNLLTANTGGNLTIEQARNVTVRGNMLVGGNLILRDYYRGADYTIRNVRITGNRFKNACVETWEGAWDAASTATKSIVIDGNIYDNTSSPLMLWGGIARTTLAACQSLGFEQNGMLTWMVV